MNLIGSEGMAMIASPERVLGESTAEGLLVAELDLERVRALRRIAPKLSGSGGVDAGRPVSACDLSSRRKSLRIAQNERSSCAR